MLRVPLLPAHLSPSSRTVTLAAGGTAVLQYSYKYDDTFRAFERMTKDFPDTPFIHYAYASALDILSRYDDATSQLREEARINPGSALTHQLIASIALKQHRPNEAMSAARHAVELDSQSAGAHELLGRALLELGNVEPAVQELETASKLAPNYPGVHFGLGRAYAKAKRPADAQRACNFCRAERIRGTREEPYQSRLMETPTRRMSRRRPSGEASPAGPQ